MHEHATLSTIFYLLINMSKVIKSKLAFEVGIVTASLVAVTSVLQYLSSIPFIGRYHSLAFALMFLYIPLVVIQKRGRKIDFLGRDVKSYLRSILVFLITSVIVFPLFFLAAHFWQDIVYNITFQRFSLFPKFWSAVAFQFIMIALPEEMFFRGYVQSTLNLIFPRRWRFLGTNLGWGWIITAAIFAIAHSFVVLQWWHFAIFFPALLFGYLREKGGSITAPILFHGTANIAISLVGHWYG